MAPQKSNLYKKIADFCIQALIGVCLTATVNVLSGIRHDLNELSSKMSTIVERVSDHETRFNRQGDYMKSIDGRVRDLEVSEAAKHGHVPD